MSDTELAEQMKTRIPEIKVLSMSRYTDNAIAHHGVLEEDIEFIQKPFTRNALAVGVREVLVKNQR